MTYSMSLARDLEKVRRALRDYVPAEVYYGGEGVSLAFTRIAEYLQDAVGCEGRAARLEAHIDRLGKERDAARGRRP